MTYCVGMLLDVGMIFASDSRTNAGVDNVARFCKMRVFEKAGDRVICIMNAGNLSITQHAISLLEQQATKDPDKLNIWTATSMFDVATLLGEALREVRTTIGAALIASNVDASASFIIGGQIGSERQRLFMLYAEGNFIEATADTCYFQIGEIKYGKPIIDRVVRRNSSIPDAIKCTLVSFDSTMRSNLSVGMPIDLLEYRANTLKIGTQTRIDENDEYFSMIHNTWGDGLKEIFKRLPDPDWDALKRNRTLPQQQQQQTFYLKPNFQFK